MTRLLRTLAALLVAGQALAAGGPAPLRVQATPAFSACAASLGRAFASARGVPVSVDVGDAAALDGVDVLIADASELTRVLEGGPGDPRRAVALGSVPWVMVTPAGQPAPDSLSALAATASSPVAVLGGIAGREARAALSLPGAGLAVSSDAARLRAAPRALVPRSLAGPGRATPAPEVAPLSAVAAPLSPSPRADAAASFLAFLATSEGRRVFQSCGGAPPAAPAAGTKAAPRYAQAVSDWWVPTCSLERNSYNDPREVLGPPDAENLGGKDEYRGMMSLGQGGWVVVDMGRPVSDGAGADVRVYQTTSGEPVSLYAGDSPSGPFQLVGLMRGCGIASPGIFSNHCDFDLANGGVKSARYFRVEDGEIYPCLAGDTLTEGADIDAVESIR